MKINEYIESGILESYVLGAASQQEVEELLFLKAKHPEIREALFDVEINLEHIAQQMAVAPPAGVWLKIEDHIKELKKRSIEPEALVISRPERTDTHSRDKDEQFINVEGASDQMRVHKSWRWVLLGIFLLGKVFLGFAIYFYLQTKEDAREIQQLKYELSNQRRQ